MGRSYFAFLVRSKKEVQTVRELEKRHNSDEEQKTDQVGETFEPEGECILHFKNQYWLILMNQGGGSFTSYWLIKNKPKDMKIYHPFEKPKGWSECNEVYRTSEQMKNILDNLPEDHNKI